MNNLEKVVSLLIISEQTARVFNNINLLLILIKKD